MKKSYLIGGIILLLVIVCLEIYFVNYSIKPLSSSQSNLSNVQTNSEELLPTFGNCSKLSLGWKCDIDSGSVKYYNDPDNWVNFIAELDVNYKSKYCSDEEKSYFGYSGGGNILSLFCIDKFNDSEEECNSSKDCTSKLCFPTEEVLFDESFVDEIGSKKYCPNCTGRCQDELSYINSIGALSWVEYNNGYLEVKGN